MVEISDVRSQSLPTEDSPHHKLSINAFGSFPASRIHFDRSIALGWTQARCALSIRLARVPRDMKQNRKRYTTIPQKYRTPSPKRGNRNLGNVRVFLEINNRYKSTIDTMISKGAGISGRKNQSNRKALYGYKSLNLEPTVDLDKIDLLEKADPDQCKSEKVPIIMFGPTRPRPQGPQPVIKPRPR